MTRRILVPTDLSEASVPAIEMAMTLAAPLGASVDLLYVIDTSSDPQRPLPSGFEVESDEWRQAMREQAKQALRKLTSEPESLQVNYLVTFGDPVKEILFASAAPTVQMVVMSTHGRGVLRRLLMGSVAERVMHLATQPVLAIRTAGDLPTSIHTLEGAASIESSLLRNAAPKRLLVPIDLLPESVPVLIEAGELAEQLGASLSVLYVAEIAESTLPLLFVRDEDLDPKLQIGYRASEALRAFLLENADRLPANVRNAQPLVSLGKPAREIREYVIKSDADLVVMGRSDHGNPRRLGAVTERLVRDGLCPVLVVPPGA